MPANGSLVYCLFANIQESSSILNLHRGLTKSQRIQAMTILRVETIDHNRTGLVTLLLLQQLELFQLSFNYYSYKPAPSCTRTIIGVNCE